ncbi:hypothetical protein R1X32_17145 [Rhodococcus opacus]|uniref:hypothetical protein n=1 Tax=Rhodococcus opacus TaxID=37919 RepID=UPI0006BB471A|nr:hypothetical protein [Rhodococcus opacus]WKN58387.1 hypothetical protein HJ581_0033980 [Rhodococcus opacus]
MITITRCPHGHEIRTEADRDSTGFCRACRKVSNDAWQQKQRAARALVQSLERHGVVVDPDALTFQFGSETADMDAVADRIVATYGQGIQ